MGKLSRRCTEVLKARAPTNDDNAGTLQVVSRSLMSSGSSGLLPYMDLLNHSAGTRPPMMQLNDADQVGAWNMPQGL